MNTKLTGKAKKLFEEWFRKQPAIFWVTGKGTVILSVKRFQRLSLPFQWGILQDFAD